MGIRSFWNEEDKKKERAANGKEVAELKGEQSLGSDELLESISPTRRKNLPLLGGSSHDL